MCLRLLSFLLVSKTVLPNSVTFNLKLLSVFRFFSILHHILIKFRMSWIESLNGNKTSRVLFSFSTRPKFETYFKEHQDIYHSTQPSNSFLIHIQNKMNICSYGKGETTV